MQVPEIEPGTLTTITDSHIYNFITNSPSRMRSRRYTTRSQLRRLLYTGFVINHVFIIDQVQGHSQEFQFVKVHCKYFECKICRYLSNPKATIGFVIDYIQIFICCFLLF